jgi:hypothetical protein
MQIFGGKIKRIDRNTDGTFSFECISKAHSDMLQNSHIYSFDPAETDYDTWEEVARHIIDTLTSLKSWNIYIRDRNGTPIPSTSYSWSNASAMEMLLDICRLSSSFLYFDATGVPKMRTYEAARLSPYMIDHGKNLLANNTANDLDVAINSVTASLTYIQANSILWQNNNITSGINEWNSYFTYCAWRVTITPEMLNLTTGQFYLKKVGVPTSSLKIRLIQEDGFDSEPPGWTTGTLIAEFTILQIDVGTDFSWISEAPGSPPVDLSSYHGKNVWLMIEKTGQITPSPKYYVLRRSTSGYGFYESLDGSEATWTTVRPGKSGCSKLFGDVQVSVSGTYTDQESVDSIGLRHKSIVAKRARSDEACNQLSQQIVAFYKDGLLLASTEIPYNSFVVPGQRIIINDLKNDLYYEDLFVSSVTYNSEKIIVELSETEIEITEQALSTDTELSTTDKFIYNY